MCLYSKLHSDRSKFLAVTASLHPDRQNADRLSQNGSSLRSVCQKHINSIFKNMVSGNIYCVRVEKTRKNCHKQCLKLFIKLTLKGPSVERISFVDFFPTNYLTCFPRPDLKCLLCCATLRRIIFTRRAAPLLPIDNAIKHPGLLQICRTAFLFRALHYCARATQPPFSELALRPWKWWICVADPAETFRFWQNYLSRSYSGLLRYFFVFVYKNIVGRDDDLVTCRKGKTNKQVNLYVKVLPDINFPYNFP